MNRSMFASLFVVCGVAATFTRKDLYTKKA